MSRSARPIIGTNGRIYWDGSLIAELVSFRAATSVNRDTDIWMGSLDEDSIITSTSGSGDMVVKKVYSRMQDYHDAIVSGEDPRISVSGYVENKSRGAKGKQRVTISDVFLNEITVLEMIAGQKMEETVPFGYVPSSVNWDDVIEAD